MRVLLALFGISVAAWLAIILIVVFIVIILRRF